MPNPLYKLLGNNTASFPSDMQNFFSRLEQFKQNLNGDPREQVQQLLNSGKMTQSQFNQLSQMATQIQNILMNK